MIIKTLYNDNASLTCQLSICRKTSTKHKIRDETLPNNLIEEKFKKKQQSNN